MQCAAGREADMKVGRYSWVDGWMDRWWVDGERERERAGGQNAAAMGITCERLHRQRRVSAKENGAESSALL